MFFSQSFQLIIWMPWWCLVSFHWYLSRLLCLSSSQLLVFLIYAFRLSSSTVYSTAFPWIGALSYSIFFQDFAASYKQCDVQYDLFFCQDCQWIIFLLYGYIASNYAWQVFIISLLKNVFHVQRVRLSGCASSVVVLSSVLSGLLSFFLWVSKLQCCFTFRQLYLFICERQYWFLCVFPLVRNVCHFDRAPLVSYRLT